jgi:hypothetical protein
MTTSTEPEKDRVSWDDLDRLTEQMAARLEGDRFDVLLAIARGGLVPAGMLAYRLGIREILVAAVTAYDDAGTMAETPTILHFPADERLRGRRVLIVDEVWETGNTAVAVTERVRAAGGDPVTTVIHYKPGRSRHAAVPDVYAVMTDRWVTYPYKAGR